MIRYLDHWATAAPLKWSEIMRSTANGHRVALRYEVKKRAWNQKAVQFYKSMKQSEPSTSTSQAGKEFSASKGWLTGFLKRNALHNIKITGESVQQQMKEQQKHFQRR
ncbi:hypothetical protein TNCV_3280581 [Trichonephila clavipes]|nr:hypothetical protein TNCV_3280581 [Trichonephila clavipes]